MDYTAAAISEGSRRLGPRWTLIGNAVCVPMAEWIGASFSAPREFAGVAFRPLDSERWPKAAWGHKGKQYSANVSLWPVKLRRPKLLDFIQHPLMPLSARATEGFMRRALGGRLRYTDAFLDALTHHLGMMKTSEAA
jgi:DNA (cytosine-5)-methyltransferase 1